MTCKIRFIHRHIFDAHNVLIAQVNDAIDHKEWVTVWQHAFNLIDVINRFGEVKLFAFFLLFFDLLF